MMSCLRTISFCGASGVSRQGALLGLCPRPQQSTGRAQHRRPRALKGTGDPTVMRRLVDIMDADDDVDDDFLAEAQMETSASSQPTKSVAAPPDPNNPKNVKIRTSQYISSSTKLETCPQDGRPEFAIIGRSNVGKSSLINLMTRNKNLALTSKQPGVHLLKPCRPSSLSCFKSVGNSSEARALGHCYLHIHWHAGKTKCINHFLINGSWYLVDLPGYGYAKSSQKTRVDWNKFTKKFFLERQTLLCVLLLVDASVPPQQVDVECADWLATEEVPFLVVFTKADKSKRGAARVEDNVSAFLEALQVDIGALPDSFLTSAEAGTGGGDLLRHISALRESWVAAVGRPAAAASPLTAPMQR